MGIGLQQRYYPLYILRLVEMAGGHGSLRAMALWYLHRLFGVERASVILHGGHGFISLYAGSGTVYFGCVGAGFCKTAGMGSTL